MIVQSSWASNTDPDDESGIALFVIGDKKTEVEFKSFADFFKLQELIADAISKSAVLADKRMKERVMTTMDYRP